MRTNQRGFTLIESMVAAAMTGVLVLGASAVMNTTVGSQKKTEVQGLLDREFALGTQLAANADAVRKVTRPFAFTDTCLTKNKNTNCLTHSAPGWIPYPAPAAAKDPTFNTVSNLLGPCSETDPQARCMVKREMFYRWNCTAAECTSVETLLRVTPLQAVANQLKARETVIKLDRRQLMSRAEIAFACDTIHHQSMTKLDYDQMSDICTPQPVADCNVLPNQTYNPFASTSTNCRAPFTSSCPDGYEFTGFFSGSAQCRPPAGGRSLAGNADSVGTDSLSPQPPPPTVTNTVVTTVTCSVPYGEGLYRQDDGHVFYFNGVDAWCGFSSPAHLMQQRGVGPEAATPQNTLPPSCIRADGPCGGGASPEPTPTPPAAPTGSWRIERNDFSGTDPSPQCAADFWVPSCPPPTHCSYNDPCVPGNRCKYWNQSGWWDVMLCAQ